MDEDRGTDLTARQPFLRVSTLRKAQCQLSKVEPFHLTTSALSLSQKIRLRPEDHVASRLYGPSGALPLQGERVEVSVAIEGVHSLSRLQLPHDQICDRRGHDLDCDLNEV